MNKELTCSKFHNKINGSCSNDPATVLMEDQSILSPATVHNKFHNQIPASNIPYNTTKNNLNAGKNCEKNQENQQETHDYKDEEEPEVFFDDKDIEEGLNKC